MGFIFYDTETTGTSPALDQILQFAAIETDEELNEISSINIRCRILPYIVPAPSALLVTGIRPRDLLSANKSHLEMVSEIRSWILERSPCVVMGHNSIKFDEPMLRHAFYRTLHPLYLTNTAGNRRGDTMRVAQAAAIFAPDAITVPISVKGRPSFKLGGLARANGIDFTEAEAHDALADVRATAKLARILRQRVPAIWEQMLTNGSKASAIDFITNKAAFCLAEVHYGNPSSWLVSAFAVNPANNGQFAVFDLAYDPADYFDLGVDDIVAVMNRKEKAIRIVQANNQPIMVDTRIGRNLVEASDFDRETLIARAQRIRDHDEFREKVGIALMRRYPDKEPSAYAEERIYDGFANRIDENLMRQFHEASPEQKIILCGKLSDERYAELGLKLLYAEMPHEMPYDAQQDMARHFRERLLTEEKVPWLTLPRAFLEIADLRAKGADAVFLDEISEFLVEMKDSLSSADPHHS